MVNGRFPGPDRRLLPRVLGRPVGVRDLVLAAVVVGILAVALTYLPFRQDRIVGPAGVIDGDSLSILGEQVRLIGMDAPELSQDCLRDDRPWACGEAARRHLLALVAAEPAVTCTVIDHDRYGRALCVCATRAEPDLGRRMVVDGLAVSFGRYSTEEADARSARRGLWGGVFERPADFRAAHPRPHR